MASENDVRERAFDAADTAVCLSLFDRNCPAYFAPNERADYAEYLNRAVASPGEYRVLFAAGEAVAAFGLQSESGAKVGRLVWILTDPEWAGRGLGAQMMERTIASARERGLERVEIAASQHSAPFFARFGARTRKRTDDGWGPGMDRIDMELGLDPRP